MIKVQVYTPPHPCYNRPVFQVGVRCGPQRPPKVGAKDPRGQCAPQKALSNMKT